MLTTFKNLFTKPLMLVLCVGFIFSCSKENSSAPTPPSTPPTTPPVSSPVVTDVNFWLTTSNGGTLFTRQNIGLIFGNNTNGYSTITVDTTLTYQSIDGFGYALTGGSASLIHSMADDKRAALLQELFKTDSTFIGISYLRISIGASDMSASPFTYDDISSGTDTNLSQFSLSPEQTHLIPLLKEIIAINPKIKILGSPWSAPVWMKTNSSFKGGSLNTSYYDVYAQYFVKYIQGMAAAGITIDAITPQNEPLNPNNNPSMSMTSAEQTNFIKNNLGPAFSAAGLNTKIILYDHNCDKPSYPLDILADATAYNYADGSAFHLYGGNITALTDVHNAYPNKNVYFTEQWTSSTETFSGDLSWHVKNLIIGATRNWSRNVLEWNFAADPSQGPHTSGGCSTCLGALTVNGNLITRNVSYYIIAHASKFVRPGSVRVNTSIQGTLQNVAFKTPDGHKVLIVLNDNTSAQTFNIGFKNKIVTATLDGGSVATFVW